MAKHYCYFVPFIFLGATISANTGNVMSLWAEIEPSQNNKRRDDSQINGNLIQKQALQDPAGTLSGGVIA
jgi:hypothetical protein